MELYLRAGSLFSTVFLHSTHTSLTRMCHNFQIHWKIYPTNFIIKVNISYQLVFFQGPCYLHKSLAFFANPLFSVFMLLKPTVPPFPIKYFKNRSLPDTFVTQSIFHIISDSFKCFFYLQLTKIRLYLVPFLVCVFIK